MELVAENSNLVRSEEIIGVNVVNLDNESLGKIYDIVLNKISGQVAYVVLESGAIFGLGGKLFALPWIIFKFDPSANAFKIDLSKEEIEVAPGFDKDNWPKNNNSHVWDQATAYYENL